MAICRPVKYNRKKEANPKIDYKMMRDTKDTFLNDIKRSWNYNYNKIGRLNRRFDKNPEQFYLFQRGIKNA